MSAPGVTGRASAKEQFGAFCSDAKALGLTFPITLLGRADEVIIRKLVPPIDVFRAATRRG
jgi:hypothetical protein